MKVRRSADPYTVRQLYEAIDCIRKQRQIANLHRIVKYVYACSMNHCFFVVAYYSVAYILRFFKLGNMQ